MQLRCVFVEGYSVVNSNAQLQVDVSKSNNFKFYIGTEYYVLDSE